MTEPLLAVIGGSGLYDLPGLTDTRWVAVDTPWGAPSRRSTAASRSPPPCRTPARVASPSITGTAAI